jgi:hypothetical protein
MKVAYVFASPRAASYRLGQMILPQLEVGTHGVEVVKMLLMMCDMCALERGVAEGQPRWCDTEGRARTAPAECRVRDTVSGVHVGCVPGLYQALAGNPPHQVITL